MAMDFLGGVKGATLGESAKTLVDEGLVTAGTFIGTSFVGGQTEKIGLPKDADGNPISITDVSPTGDKIKAWAANNVPKVLAWFYLRKHVTGLPEDSMYEDASKALATSVMYDTLVRVSNKGVAPMYPTIFGLGDDGAITEDTQSLSSEDVHRILQENAALKQQITGLVKGSKNVRSAEDMPRPDRERQYGFMEPPAVETRRREFGFSGDKGGESIANVFGML